MGLKLNGRYISLILAVQIAYLVQAVRAAGKCDEVFKGFSNCLLKLGESVVNYPQGLDDKTNIKTMCTPWLGLHCPRGCCSLEWAEEGCSAVAQSNRGLLTLPAETRARGRENCYQFLLLEQSSSVFLSLCF
ncbi:neuritin isoform X2 [Pipistrellus kuhlii]|uniref:neuritin isoform X2 n=1 Tax=Pipistrellus kuhlii TaxID=59472 RepID=UPI00174F6F96|nr:neuritin isoform X2 [Pipistrellus kuhlii]